MSIIDIAERARERRIEEATPRILFIAETKLRAHLLKTSPAISVESIETMIELNRPALRDSIQEWLRGEASAAEEFPGQDSAAEQSEGGIADGLKQTVRAFSARALEAGEDAAEVANAVTSQAVALQVAARGKTGAIAVLLACVTEIEGLPDGEN